MRGWLLSIPPAFAALALAVACSSTPATGNGGSSGTRCTSGAVVPCTCTGADQGTQTCSPSGTFGACMCPDAGLPDASGTGGSGGTGTGGGGGTGGGSTGTGGVGGDAGVPPGKPVVVVPGLSGVQDLAVYTGNVYWTGADGGGTVRQCPITGCATSTLLGANQILPRGIAVSSGVILWAVGQGVDADGGVADGFLARATANTPGSAQAFLGGQLQPDPIAADPNHVYWTAGGEIRQCPIFGCVTPTVLAADVAQAIVVDASFLYWTSAPKGHVKRCDIGGCGSPLVISGTDQAAVRGLVVAGGYVFWATSSVVLRCPVVGCATPEAFASQQNIVALRHPLASDGKHVYWSSDKSVVRCAVASCGPNPPQVVAAGQSEPTSVAIDEGHVYWVDGDTIKRVAKPE